MAIVLAEKSTQSHPATRRKMFAFGLVKVTIGGQAGNADPTPMDLKVLGLLVVEDKTENEARTRLAVA